MNPKYKELDADITKLAEQGGSIPWTKKEIAETLSAMVRDLEEAERRLALTEGKPL